MVEFNGGSKSNVNIRDNTFDGTPNNYPEGVDAAIRFVNCTGTNRYITDNHFPLEIDPPTLYLFFFSYFAAINIYNSDNITICSNEMDNAIVGSPVSRATLGAHRQAGSAHGPSATHPWATWTGQY